MQAFSCVVRDYVGTRLVSFLRKTFPEVSKQAIMHAIRYHGCRVNNQVERFESYKVQWGDTIELSITQQRSIQFLLERDEFCVIDKPENLSTEDLIKDLGMYMVHRLDRDTSGCLLLAKSATAAEKLMALFKNRVIHKEYRALVLGKPKGQSGVVRTYTTPIYRRCGAVLFGNTTPDRGKLTITEWAVIKAYRKATLLCCRPITGRTHQIRVHMKHLGHPIIGDMDYGQRQQLITVHRPYLHAYRLQFCSPFTSETIFVESPVPFTVPDGLK